MNTKVFEHLAPNSAGNYPQQDPTCTYSGAPQMSIAMQRGVVRASSAIQTNRKAHNIFPKDVYRLMKSHKAVD